jgi:HrpA-like RNA helicase
VEPEAPPVQPRLPVEGFKDKILDAVHSYPVTIVTAETGAGKSTQVPQYLLDAGYGVIVTQPRRRAARAVAARV